MTINRIVPAINRIPDHLLFWGFGIVMMFYGVNNYSFSIPFSISQKEGVALNLLSFQGIAKHLHLQTRKAHTKTVRAFTYYYSRCFRKLAISENYL